MRKFQTQRGRGTAGHFPTVIRTWLRHLMTGAAFFCLTTVMARGQNPLEPHDRSSPRAALKTFLDAGDAAATYMARDYLVSPTRRDYDRLVSLGSVMVRGLDLSEVPPASHLKTGWAAGSALYVTLCRIQLPPLEEIPDAAELARLTGSDATRWGIPHTQIALQLAKTGPDAGSFLFTPATIHRAGEFYEKVLTLPNIRPVPLENIREITSTSGGWMVPYSWIQALPGSLRVAAFGQPLWKWLSFLVMLIAVALLSRVAYKLSRLGSPRHPFARALSQLALPAFFLGVIPAVAYLALVQLNLNGDAGSGIELAASLLIYLSGVWISWRLGPVVAEAIIASPRIGAESIDAHLIRICARLAGMIGGAGLLAAGASDLGLPVYGVVAGLGVGGLAFALAAQPSIENLIGGFSLFADKPIRVGDLCDYGTGEGTVEAIGIRSTRIRGRDRSLTTIPNAQLSKIPIISLTQRNQLLIQCVIGVRYDTSPEQLRHLLAAIRGLLLEHPKIDPGAARARLVNFGPSSLDIEVFAYVKTSMWPEFLEVREDVFLRVMDLVKESGTGIAFPSRTVYFGRDGGLDPARTGAAEAAVRQWHDEGKLPFRNFTPDPTSSPS